MFIIQIGLEESVEQAAENPNVVYNSYSKAPHYHQKNC